MLADFTGTASEQRTNPALGRNLCSFVGAKLIPVVVELLGGVDRTCGQHCPETSSGQLLE
jgi:hypothetical protein